MLTIKEVFEILKKRIVLISIIVLFFTGVSIIVSNFVIKPKYVTSMKILIGKEKGAEAEYSSNEVSMYQRLMTTYAKLYKTEDLIQEALDENNIQKSAKSVMSNLNVTAGEEDQLMSISITTLDKKEGVILLNAITSKFIQKSKELIKNGDVNVIETPKEPTAPSSPNKKMNVMVAFAMGVMLSVTLSLFLEYLDNTVKTKAEIEKLLDVPVLGSVPEVEKKEEDDIVKMSNEVEEHRKNRAKRSKKNSKRVMREEKQCQV